MPAIAPTRSDASTGGSGSTASWLRALEMTAHIADRPTRTLPVIVEEIAASRGDAPALISERECLSYAALVRRANRYARWALAQGLAKGETVCLMMPSRPEYMAIWLGITRVGGVVALLNTRLIGPSLAHCVDTAGPQHIIVASECADAFEAVRPHLATPAEAWIEGGDRPGFRDLDDAVQRQSGQALVGDEIRPVTIEDRALCIYTSGTTGLPKAAIVNHHRLVQWSNWFAGMIGTVPSDRMYDCLPMHHSVGGVVATGAMLVAGASVAIRDGFSASAFWDDVVRWDCTLFQYIGELCRYLLHAPPSPAPGRHRVRLAVGNGLRSDIWETFQNRFAVPRVLEFYAATEGNVSLYNVEGKPGAIGRIPPFLAHRFPIALVRFDVETEQPVRGADGLCLRCGPDEIGEAIGRIASDPARLGSRYDGYTDAAASERKVLRGVFEPGDAWFRTGDLMRRDRAGYFYFVDRIGDTFRWKGENVSTSEVAEAIGACPGVGIAVVYGVTIPGTDGRACMAAIVPDGPLDLAALRDHVETRLPHYARPLFLRIQAACEVTATLKLAKQRLVRQAYDPSATTDALYFNDNRAGAFVPLDRALYERIQAGSVRV